MRYVIAARYNDRGEPVCEEGKDRLVLDCPVAKAMVAQLNGRRERGEDEDPYERRKEGDPS